MLVWTCVCQLDNVTAYVTYLISSFITYVHQTLIHLIDRKTKKEVGIKFYTDAMAVYHQVNAFEDDGHVVFDVICYDDNSLYDMFYLDKLKEQMGADTMYCKPKCKRFVLPLSDMVCYVVAVFARQCCIHVCQTFWLGFV